MGRYRFLNKYPNSAADMSGKSLVKKLNEKS
jgi:uncharacterized protein YvpB